jgi:GEVED domain/Secretion system C-terminal sorting domain
MKKIYLLCLILFIVSSVFAQLANIGNGTTTGGTSFPIYRSSAGSGFVFSAGNQVIPASVLSAAGVLNGSTITTIAWDKNNTAGTAVGRNGNMTIRMKNSAAVSASISETWLSIKTGATIVYNNTTQTIPTTAGFWTITLSTPFVYTGGALEISVDWTINGLAAAFTTAQVPFNYSTNTGTNLGTILGTSSYSIVQGNSAATLDATVIGANTPGVTFNNVGKMVNTQIGFTAPLVCSGTPNNGTATSTSAAACTGQPFSLGVTGGSVGSGFTYQWQSSPASANTFTNLGSSQPSSGYSVASQTAATDYQVITTCTASGLSATSSIVSVAQNGFLSCYCVTTPTTVNGVDIITNVTMGALNNTSTSPANNFTSYNNTPIDLAQGVPQNISITFGTDGTQFSAVWIDFNQDGLFDASENVALATIGAGGGATVNYSLAIPSGATLGQTRMRVRGGDDNAYTASGACTTSAYGETEDYLVNITSPPACLPALALTNTGITGTGASHSWTAPTPAPASGYEWAATTSSTPPTSGTATSGTSVSSTTLSPSTTYYLHVRSNCGSGFSSWVTSPSFNTPCAADNTPYTMPITTVTIPALPLCTSIQNIGNLPNTWISAGSASFGATINAAYTMPVMAYIYNTTNPANDWLFTNALNLTAGTSYTLKFKYSNDLGTLYPEAMDVAYGSANNATAMINPLASYPSISGATPNDASIVFTPTATGLYYVGFHAYSDADQDVLILDDVEVIVTPSCFPVTGLTITSSTTNANLSWTAVPSAINGYEYVVDAVATSPVVAGTPQATTSVSVAGTYIIGSTYYAHVRSICSGVDFSTWTNVPFIIPPTCTTNLTPVNGATNLSNPIPLLWNASVGATSYNVLLSSDGGATYTNVGNVTGTTANLSVVTTGNYSWYVQPSNGGLASGCASSATTFSTASAPTNDICTNAINLNVSNGFCASPVLGNLAFADSTNGLGGASCNSSALKFDVWYKVTVPASGNVTVQTSAVNTVVTDLVMEAYSGSCGTLTSIDCNDDGNPDPSPSTNHSKLGLVGRASGEVIYFRVMPYSSLTNAGAFAICAFDTSASLTPPVALGTANSCTPAIAINIDSTFKYTWATFKDASGNIIAQVYPNGNKLGTTSASVYNYAGAVRQAGGYYLDRNITITPATQPVSGNVQVRLFYTAAELAALQVVDATATNTNMNTTKIANTSCSAAFPSGAISILSQFANGAYATTDRYIDVNAPSFSEFFIKSPSSVLPISIEFFKGKKQGSANYLDWKVTCTNEPSLTLTLERSADGRNFKTLNDQNATATRCLQGFDYTDALPLGGANYYRLKVTSTSGKVYYSTIVVLLNKEKGFELISVAPNPTKNIAILTLTSVKAGNINIIITDVIGKVVAKQTVNVIAGNNPIDMNFATLGAGTYTIAATNAEGEVKTTRFVKY